MKFIEVSIAKFHKVSEPQKWVFFWTFKESELRPETSAVAIHMRNIPSSSNKCFCWEKNCVTGYRKKNNKTRPMAYGCPPLKSEMNENFNEALLKFHVCQNCDETSRETLAKFRISFNWSFIESFNWNFLTIGGGGGGKWVQHDFGGRVWPHSKCRHWQITIKCQQISTSAARCAERK